MRYDHEFTEMPRAMKGIAKAGMIKRMGLIKASQETGMFLADIDEGK